MIYVVWNVNTFDLLNRCPKVVPRTLQRPKMSDYPILFSLLLVATRISTYPFLLRAAARVRVGRLGWWSGRVVKMCCSFDDRPERKWCCAAANQKRWQCSNRFVSGSKLFPWDRTQLSEDCTASSDKTRWRSVVTERSLLKMSWISLFGTTQLTKGLQFNLFILSVGERRAPEKFRVGGIELQLIALHQI